MGLVGRTEGDAEADVDDGGAEDVGKRLDAVGDQSERVADEADHTFEERQEEVGDDAEERRAKAAVHVEFGFGRGGHGRLSPLDFTLAEGRGTTSRREAFWRN